MPWFWAVCKRGDVGEVRAALEAGGREGDVNDARSGSKGDGTTGLIWAAR